MTPKADTSRQQKLVTFFLTPAGMTVLLYVLIGAAASIVHLFDAHLIEMTVQWFRDAKPDSDSSTVLLASGSISVVVWTGALIGFQLKGTSAQISGAFSLLEYAFIAPLVALLFQGGPLRVIAVGAAIAFVALIVRQVLMYLIVEWVLKRTTEGDPSNELFATDLGRRMFKIISALAIFPTRYAGACAVGALLVAIFATEYIAALTSVGALCFGLYYVLIALNDSKKSPQTPEERAIANKTFSGVIAMFGRRAEELSNNATAKANAVHVQAIGTPDDNCTADAGSADPSSELQTDRPILAADVEEVAAFLLPLSDKTLRPGMLTEGQMEKVRSFLPSLMSRAVNDKDAYEATAVLNQILAAVEPKK